MPTLDEINYRAGVKYGDKAICKHCGKKIELMRGLHITEDAWIHTWSGVRACTFVTFAEPKKVD